MVAVGYVGNSLISGMTIQKRVLEALSQLLGMPLRDAVRTCNMEMFEFGNRRTRTTRLGKVQEIGEFMLHIQCPWRIVGSDGLIVGSDDRYYPEDDTHAKDANSDGPTLCESRLNGWFKHHAESPLLVERAECDCVGSFKLYLQRCFVLEVFPTCSSNSEYSEFWRLFRPSDEESHFVISATGIEK